MTMMTVKRVFTNSVRVVVPGADGEGVAVILEIDEEALAVRLGRKAIKNKGGKATLLNGIIRVTVI